MMKRYKTTGEKIIVKKLESAINPKNIAIVMKSANEMLYEAPTFMYVYKSSKLWMVPSHDWVRHLTPSVHNLIFEWFNIWNSCYHWKESWCQYSSFHIFVVQSSHEYTLPTTWLTLSMLLYNWTLLATLDTWYLNFLTFKHRNKNWYQDLLPYYANILYCHFQKLQKWLLKNFSKSF